MLERDAPILSAVVRAEKRGEQWRRLGTPVRRFVPDRWARGRAGAPDMRTAAVADVHEAVSLLPEIPAMPPLPTACLAIALLAAAATAHGQDASRTHYVMLVNRAHDSVTALAVADPGSTTFRAISADLQRSAAETLFVTDKSLEDIAIEIGYSDVRSLRRACQRWFGVTPTVYRRGRRGRRQHAARAAG
jgi:hypothetical protein